MAAPAPRPEIDADFAISEEHCECGLDEKNEVDEVLGLQAISIRLPKQLINDFRLFAILEGIGYQPLIRQVLDRLAEAEHKKIALDEIHRQLKDKAGQEPPP